MQNVFVKAEEFVDHVKEYINNRITAVKLQAAEHASRIISDMLGAAIIGFIMLVVMIFTSLAAAAALNTWIGESWPGYLIMAFAWLVIAWIIRANKERLLRMPIMNKMLQQFFRDEENS